MISSLDVDEWSREVAAYLSLLFSGRSSAQQIRECARRFDWRLSLQPGIEVIAKLCTD